MVLICGCTSRGAWLCVWPQRTAGQGPGAGVVDAAVGETVTLTAPVTADILVFYWYRGTAATESQRILSYIVSDPNQTNGPRHTGRESGRPDGSLRITDLRTSDSGIYTVSVTLDSGAATPGSQQLRVYDILSQPNLVKINGLDYPGYNITLKCDVGIQTVERYLFFKDNLNITCDQQRITCSESSPFLHFHPLMMSDSGAYTCGIYNLVSSNTSRPLEIVVKVPISNVILSSNVSSDPLWEDEDSVHLTCLAMGTDPVYSWMYEGSALPQDPRYHLSTDKALLTISPVTRQDSGPFVCMAFNDASNMSSNPLLLNITWRPKGQIRCSAEVSGDSEALLQCSWPGGNPPALVHLKHPEINGTDINEVTGNISRSNLLHGTEMFCYGSQEGHTQNCSLLFDVPYDPGFHEGTIVSTTEGKNVSLEVNLKRSHRATIGDRLPASFRWFVNRTSSVITPGNRVTITTNVSFSLLTIFGVTESDNGEYRCEAENLVGTANFSFIVNITKVPVSPEITNQLSAGAIAGIVVGVVALLVLIGIAIFFIVRKTKDKVPETKNRSNTGKSLEAVSPYSTVLDKVAQKDEPFYINVEPRPAEHRYETLVKQPAENKYEVISPKSAENKYEVISPKSAAPEYSNIIVKKTPRVR
ncbi:hypothetical protein NDU88_011493 [Pleurodeles waltl]|uniref:Ig-like domain-containing protein n=1 Tax=Pleurodeles waltl TaxID=8319 RepID=A0AAV7Q0W6_PLEWA|nr:hypothetical protein NDU88_011493 [Pleurodeles waltl]